MLFGLAVIGLGAANVHAAVRLLDVGDDECSLLLVRALRQSALLLAPRDRDWNLNGGSSNYSSHFRDCIRPLLLTRLTMWYPVQGRVTVCPTSTICSTGDEIVTVIVGGFGGGTTPVPTAESND